MLKLIFFVINTGSDSAYRQNQIKSWTRAAFIRHMQIVTNGKGQRTWSNITEGAGGRDYLWFTSISFIKVRHFLWIFNSPQNYFCLRFYFYYFQNSLQRVERELYTLKRDNTGLTPQILIQHLTEEVTVQSAIVKEKLPSELNAKKNRMRALTIIKDYSYLGPDKIVTMRNDLDMVLKDIQDLVESKVSMHKEWNHPTQY